MITLFCSRSRTSCQPRGHLNGLACGRNAAHISRHRNIVDNSGFLLIIECSHILLCDICGILDPDGHRLRIRVLKSISLNDLCILSYLCLITRLTLYRFSKNIGRTIFKESEFIRILNSVIVQIQDKTSRCELSACTALIRIVGKSGNVERIFRICLAYNAIKIRGGLIFCVPIPLYVLRPVDHLNRCVFIILHIPEDKHILFFVCREYKTFLICIRSISGNRYKLFCYNSVTGGCMLLHTKNIPCANLKILYSVVDFIFRDINECEFVPAVDVHRHRVTGGYWEVSGAVALIKLSSCLCIESLCRTRKRTSLGLRCYDSSTVFKRIPDGILDKFIRAPLRIKHKVSCNSH